MLFDFWNTKCGIRKSNLLRKYFSKKESTSLATITHAEVTWSRKQLVVKTLPDGSWWSLQKVTFLIPEGSPWNDSLCWRDKNQSSFKKIAIINEIFECAYHSTTPQRTITIWHDFIACLYCDFGTFLLSAKLPKRNLNSVSLANKVLTCSLSFLVKKLALNTEKNFNHDWQKKNFLGKCQTLCQYFIIMSSRIVSALWLEASPCNL